MIKSKSTLALITFGVILFIVGIIGTGISILILFYAVDSGNFDSEEFIGGVILTIGSLILGYYVRATNFGMQKSDIEDIIEEKEKLKLRVEISELKKKLNSSDS
jgi:hypothetical protein